MSTKLSGLKRRLRITDVLISKHRDTDTAWMSCPQPSLHKKATKLNCFKVLSRTSNNTLAALHTSKIKGWIIYGVFKQATGIWESHQMLSRYPCKIQNQCCRWEAPGTTSRRICTAPRESPSKQSLRWKSSTRALPSPPILWLKIWKIEHLLPRQQQSLKRAESEVMSPITPRNG